MPLDRLHLARLDDVAGNAGAPAFASMLPH